MLALAESSADRFSAPNANAGAAAFVSAAGVAVVAAGGGDDATDGPIKVGAELELTGGYQRLELAKQLLQDAMAEGGA